MDETKVKTAMYLQSPDGGVWQITVNSNGDLETVKIGTLPVPSPF